MSQEVNLPNSIPELFDRVEALLEFAPGTFDNPRSFRTERGRLARALIVAAALYRFGLSQTAAIEVLPWDRGTITTAIRDRDDRFAEQMAELLPNLIGSGKWDL